MGRRLLVWSVLTRFAVVALLCSLALWTEYLNLKLGYNNPRLVELSSGRLARWFYQGSEALFSLFGDPMAAAQRNAGMTWSIRLFGLPFTDPLAFLSLLVQRGMPPPGFALGALIPLGLALLFGRVFCSYICPASLLFFAIERLRRALGGFFYFPDLRVSRGLAWGLLCGGLLLAIPLGHGIWTLILPYFALGQTLFHGIAFGTLSVSVFSLAFFALLDLFLGRRFTCRHLCPTGRLLGAIGRRCLISIRRERQQCVEQCHACTEVCPFEVDPKRDQTIDCSLCGECALICPTQCLSIGIKA